MHTLAVEVDEGEFPSREPVGKLWNLRGIVVSENTREKPPCFALSAHVFRYASLVKVFPMAFSRDLREIIKYGLGFGKNNNMRLILDENLPSDVKEEVIEFHEAEDFVDIDEEFEGMLDFKIVDMMDEGDLMITRDKELHENLLDTGRKSVYYDIERKNLVDIQIKITYYLKGYDNERVHESLEENQHVKEGKTQLRERFEELKKENAELRSRVNVLEGKLESVLKTAESAFEEKED